MQYSRTPLAICLLGTIVGLMLVAAALVGWSSTALSAPLRIAEIGNVHTPFRPSVNGFEFINHAGGKSNTLLGKVFQGLCGGMSYAALDYYYAGASTPTSGVDSFILKRDAQSLIANGGEFLIWSLSPQTAASGPRIAVAPATRDQIPALDKALKNGPVPLGLVKADDLNDLAQNHQVVACGLKRKGSIVRILVYDPNHPRCDNVTLRLDLSKSDPVAEYVGKDRVDQWRGFFIEDYTPETPPAS
jgi:hypothetical protein